MARDPTCTRLNGVHKQIGSYFPGFEPYQCQQHHRPYQAGLLLQFQKLRNKVGHEPSGQQLRSMSSAWTASVNPEAPWPDYPRPHLQRNAWLNLNGPWEFAGSVCVATVESVTAPEQHASALPLLQRIKICTRSTSALPRKDNCPLPYTVQAIRCTVCFSPSLVLSCQHFCCSCFSCAA